MTNLKPRFSARTESVRANSSVSEGCNDSASNGSMNIHPTAIIDPGAAIHSSCKIGPYCVIGPGVELGDRKSTRLNSSHGYISYAVFCLKKKKNEYIIISYIQ